MQKYFDSITGANGVAATGAVVTVLNYGTTTPASIFSDAAGLVAKTNPIAADATGYFDFYAADGRYSLSVSAAGFATKTLTDIQLEDTKDGLAVYSASSGSSLVGHLSAGTGAVARTTQSKLRESVSVKDFGAVGDGVTDDTAAIQSAIACAQATHASLFIPATANSYKVTAPLNITGGISIRGDGCSPYLVSVYGQRGPGSWIQLAHLGHGFVIDNGASMVSGVVLEKVGTFRNQATPGAGWAPLATGYDIYIGNADVHLTKVTLWNPSYGVRMNGNSGGRLQIDGLYGQPLIRGIFLEVVMDVCRINDVHFWPYWYNDPTYIHAYTKVNLVAVLLERADNAVIGNLFSIFAATVIRFGYNASGYSQRVQLSNIGCDAVGVSSIGVIAGANGTSFTANGLYGYGGNNANYGVLVLANDCLIQMSAVRFSVVGYSASSINGTGNVAQYTNWLVDGYNRANNSSPCFFTGGGNKTYLSDKPVTVAANPANVINSVSTTSIGHTVAYGIFAIANPATSLVVTHGLGYAPAAYQINIQPTSAQYPAGLYTSNITSTQFTINCNPTPTGSANGNWTIDGRSAI